MHLVANIPGLRPAALIDMSVDVCVEHITLEFESFGLLESSVED
jgi:hypothetical protein